MLQPEPFSLGELVQEVAAETRMLDAAHEYRIEPGDVMINADRALIKQALRILVDNAVKYTDAGGRITLTADSDGGSWQARLPRQNGIASVRKTSRASSNRFYPRRPVAGTGPPARRPRIVHRQTGSPRRGTAAISSHLAARALGTKKSPLFAPGRDSRRLNLSRAALWSVFFAGDGISRPYGRPRPRRFRTTGGDNTTGRRPFQPRPGAAFIGLRPTSAVRPESAGPAAVLRRR
jgi:hypothetical protein